MEEGNKAHKDYSEFWKEIVEKDGVLDIEQVKKELSDFLFIIRQLPKVYMHITNGVLSKHMYSAETVISVYNDCLEEQINDTKIEVATEILDIILNEKIEVPEYYTEENIEEYHNGYNNAIDDMIEQLKAKYIKE